ncbi:MAG: hypothetical protein WAW92_01825 [Minisyncoccia bacterium]
MIRNFKYIKNKRCDISNGNMINNYYKKGGGVLEIIIAFAVLSMTLSAVIMIIFGNQSLSVDNQVFNEAIYRTSKGLETVRSLSRVDFLSVTSTTTTEISGGISFLEKITVTDISQCKKQATTTTSWTVGGTKNNYVEMGTILTDKILAKALGGDCIDNSPTSSWDNPNRFASDTMNPAKPTALDELNRIVYIGADKSPFLFIASTTYATLNQNSGLFLTFTNGFDAKKQINAIDAARYPATGKIYAFAAIASSTEQLEIIDVTNPLQPTAIFRGLSSCVTGSAPQGFLVYFYKNTLYLTTRYTAGPEFHIFDVSNPLSPTEYPIGSVACKGLELGSTVEDIVVQDQIIGGVAKRLAYFATDEIDKELRVFDVTNPLSITEITSANQNLPGAQDGMSLFVIGNKLFLGRQSNPAGPDLYVYDISNANSTTTYLGSVDIGTGVNAIRVAGKFAFIATPKTNQEFQVWNIENLSNITNIAKYNFGNVVNRGIDYDPDFIYSTGQSTPNFQIIYSP